MTLQGDKNHLHSSQRCIEPHNDGATTLLKTLPKFPAGLETAKEILKKAREPPSCIPSSSIDIAKLFEKLSLIKLGKDLYEKLYKEHKKQVNSTRFVRTLTERPCVSSRGFEYIEKVDECDLPDGRKRFVLYILLRYLANVKQLSDEDAMKIIHRFVENSCRNFGNCGKIYDSWIRSVLRGVRIKQLIPYNLTMLCSEDENKELCSIINEVLGQR